jgi:hypothetical protein
MKKFIYCFIPLSLLFLGGDVAPINHVLDPKLLTGNINLSLKNAVWRLQKDKPVYQTLTLDLTCQEGKCEHRVWGYAPKFNIDVDHLGTVKVQQSDRVWLLTVDMSIQDHPWRSQFDPAQYTIEIVPYKNKLFGSYTGRLKNRTLRGKVQGKAQPFTTITLDNHLPLEPQEHPRLVFRKSALGQLRSQAQTPEGKAIIAQIEKSLQQPIYYQGYVPTGGYHAAAYCFLSLLKQDTQSAEKGWEITEKSLSQPGRRLLEQSSTVAGVALAYDMCYDAWGQARQEKISQWLQAQANQLLRGSSAKSGWNSNPWSNWHARARGAAGLAALAILQEPSLKNPDPYQAEKAARHILRYFSTAIGPQGLGSEGDHYTTEPLVLTVIPFLLAYRQVLGQDLITNSHAGAIIPHYLHRTIPTSTDFRLGAYGRHRRYAGKSLFAMGLGMVPPGFLPAVLGLFEPYLALRGDKSFGIELPYQGIYVFTHYPPNTKIENPAQHLDKVLVDREKGFVSFRNRWQDETDISASIYIKQQELGASWSFPDVGSFRILGLGSIWASPGKPGGKITEENTIYIPNIPPWKTAQTTFFFSSPDGSGLVSLESAILPPQNSGISSLKWIRSLGVDYSQSSGSAGLFVVVDEFQGDNNHPNFRDKTWIMHTQGEVTLERNTFLIRTPEGITLQGTFISSSPVNLSVVKTADGQKIVATNNLDYFWVVMTLQKGIPPLVKVNGQGLNAIVKVGKQEITYLKNRIFWSVF